MIVNTLIANGYTLDLADNIPTPLNRSIADLLNPDKRTRNFSKTIDLEGTQNNCAHFASTFSFSASNNNITFDATARVPAKLYKRGVLIVDGVIQLNKVTLDKGRYTFTITLFSEVTNGFLILKNTKISELGWGDYTHTLTQANIAASWSTGSGTGYRYPLIERGNGRVSPTTWRTIDLVPYVHVVEVFDKIMQLIGINYTSTQLSTGLFRNILIGYGGGDVPSIPASDVNDRFIDVQSGNYTYSFTAIPAQATPTGQLFISTFPKNIISDETLIAIVAQDNLSQYDNGEITAQITGKYKLSVTLSLQWEYGAGAPGNIYGGAPIVKLLKNGSEVANSNIYNPSTIVIGRTGTVDFSFSQILQLQSGDQLQIQVCPVEGRTNNSEPLTLDISTSGAMQIQFESLDTQVTDGSTIELDRYVPDMNCSDFLLGFIRQFYLYISDPDDNGIVTVEPLVNFYKPTTEFYDVTKLVDYSKPFVSESSANKYPKTTSFTFAENKDADALTYRERFNERYGDFTLEQGSYYAKGDQPIKLPWGTIVPYDLANGLICPRFITIDSNGVIKPNKGAARIILWNGLKAGDWELQNENAPLSPTSYNTYPSVHHFDDYEAPTFDLNFKLVSEVFYNTGTITTANTYSIYYYPFINEITAPSGEVITCYIRFNALDVAKMDFSKLFMINGKLFRLNKIFEFDDNVQATTKTELLKVLEAKNPRRITIYQPQKDSTFFNNATVNPAGRNEDINVLSGGDNTVDANSQIIQG